MKIVLNWIDLLTADFKFVHLFLEALKYKIDQIPRVMNDYSIEVRKLFQA